MTKLEKTIYEANNIVFQKMCAWYIGSDKELVEHMQSRNREIQKEFIKKFNRNR